MRQKTIDKTMQVHAVFSVTPQGALAEISAILQNRLVKAS